MSDYYSTAKQVQAKKTHRCAWCGERIESGETYCRSFVVCDGSAWTKKLHPECHEAEKAYDFDGEPLYYEGQMERGHSHERFADTIYQNALYDCPYCLAQPLETAESIDVIAIVKLLLEEYDLNMLITQSNLIGCIGKVWRVSRAETLKIANILFELRMLGYDRAHGTGTYWLTAYAQEMVGLSKSSTGTG